MGNQETVTYRLGREACCEAALYRSTTGQWSAVFGECKCAQPFVKAND
jgi:hypothetical protein